MTKKIFVEPTDASVAAALQFIDPTDQDTWVKVGMGVKQALGEAGFSVWDDWSRRADNYTEGAAKARWKSFKANGAGVGIGTVFDMAKAAGWVPSEDMQAAPIPPEERERRDRERKALQQAANEAREAKERQQAIEAQRRFNSGYAEGKSPYLVRKMIQAHGVRFVDPAPKIVELMGEAYTHGDQCILVPLTDVEGAVWSLQTIYPCKWKPGDSPITTDKIVLKESRKSGSMHWLAPADEGSPGWILIAEGYATAATVHEATGLPTVMCVDSGNMAKVAKAIRAKYPNHRLMFCADDDQATFKKTSRNPGLNAAHSAATEVGGYWCSPQGLEPKESDFNDLHVRAGLAVVKQQLEAALNDPKNPEPPTHGQGAEGSPVQGSATADSATTATNTATGGNTGTPATASPTAKKPRKPKTYGGRFKVNADGVFYHVVDENGQAKRPIRVCSELHVRGLTRDQNDSSWGFLLEWPDPLGNMHTWSMPRRLLAGDGAAYREALLDMGLSIAPGAAPKNLLHQYIAESGGEVTFRCVEQVGWYDNQFVLPDTTYGQGDEQVIYQCEVLRKNLFETRGSLESWRDNVSRLSAGNSRLMFAISCAFAGPLLKPTGVESGGFHFTGNSSSGKSTTINVASSVWGSPDFKRQWRATDNALEAVAAAHSDTLLVLDELGQADSRTVGDTAYMLANGAGRERMSSKVALRPALRWRVLFISTGEQPLKDKMAEVGKKAHAGQELRVADIPFAVEGGSGGFETIQGYGQAAEFAKALSSAAATDFGHAGRAFVQKVCEDPATAAALIGAHADRLVNAWVPAKAVGQVFRVAKRFTIAAAAGEYATAMGLTDWEQGDAEWAAKICFESWLDKRGTIELSEHRDMIETVRAFLSVHNARFQWWHRVNDDHAPNVLNRAGFKKRISANGKAIETHQDEFREHGDKVGAEDNEAITLEYYVLPTVFRDEVCKGFDPRAVATLLYDKGYLEAGEAAPGGGRPRLDKKVRLPGLSLTRCYVIKPEVFGQE